MKTKSHKISKFAALINILLLSLTASLYADPEEILFENLESDNAEAWVEELDHYKSHPISINQVSQKELDAFPLITTSLSKQIVSERNKSGLYKSWLQFAQRLKLNHEDIIWMRKYFLIEEKTTSPVKIHIRSRIMQKSPESEGFSSGKYTGSRQKSYERMNVKYSEKIQFGLLSEKDPGEARWNDHWTVYMDFKPTQFIRILMGHFRMDAGQGLVLSGPYGMAKSAMPIAPARKSRSRLINYSLSDETHDFFGIASEIHISQLTLHLFSSNSKRDATLTESNQILSLTQSGLHRTESEKNHLNKADEKCSGFRIQLNQSNLEIGMTGWQNHYSKPFSKESHHDFYDFSGSHQRVLGFDIKYAENNIRVFGETAIDKTNHMAIIAGLHIHHETSQAIISYRKYSPGFFNPHGMGFSTEEPTNREGWYSGIRHKVYKKSYISIFYDLNRTLWNTYSIPTKWWRNDAFIEGSFYLSNSVQMNIRYRTRTKEIKDIANISGREINWIREVRQNQWRCEMLLYPSKKIRIRNRLEYNQVTKPLLDGDVLFPQSKEEGWLLYQEVRLKTIPNWTITGRWTVYDTESYDSRIYLYENDIPGVMTLKPLYQKGNRSFILIQGSVARYLKFGFKWASTYYDGVTSWGTGYDEIMGDTIHELHFQCDLNW